MKKYFLSIVLLIAITNSVNGQITHDFKTAKALALKQNKLIIVDFWAVWCGPCRAMDAKLWNSPEFLKLTDRFVLLKMDVDFNRSLALSYHVKAIPRVLIITANEDKIWDEEGFKGAEYYIDLFSSFPENYMELNQNFLKISGKNKANPESSFAIGATFQKLARKTTHNTIKKSFLSLSDSYFKKAQKHTHSKALKAKTALSIALNYAYRGNHKKAMKKLQKIPIDDDLKPVQEFKDFVMAYCYKCDGDLKKMEEIKKGITDKELLSGLQ